MGNLHYKVSRIFHDITRNQSNFEAYILSQKAWCNGIIYGICTEFLDKFKFLFHIVEGHICLFNKGSRIASFKFSGIAPLESDIFTMRVMTGSRTSRHVLQQPYGNGVKVTVITCRLLDVMLDLFVTDLFTFRQTTDTVYPTAPYTRWHSTYNKHRLLHSVSEYGIRYFHISEHFQFSE